MARRFLEIENPELHSPLAIGCLPGSSGLVRAVDGVSFPLDEGGYLGPVGSRIHRPEAYRGVPSLRKRAALLALCVGTWYEEVAPPSVMGRLDLA
jgi:hypothetical protein